MIAIRNILVPTDFSETSGEALSYARGLAARLESAVHRLHVVPQAYMGPAETMQDPNLSPEHLEALWSQQARERLENEQDGGTHAVRVGHAFVEIIRYAREQDIDLIVMGTHGRGAVAHMLLGSVAEKVVRKAPCPVLTVRQPGHTFEQP